jgi:hypothetical protein
MWVNLAIWAVLVLISLALLVRSRLDKTHIINWGFLILGCGFLGVSSAFILELKNDYTRGALFFSSILLFVISNLIAVLILRKRVIPPRVQVKRTVQYRIYSIIAIVLIFAFIIYIPEIWGSRLLEKIFFLGYMTIVMIIAFFLILFEKVEICTNGVLDYGGLWPWDGYKSFSWGRNATDSFELRLKSKQWFYPPRSTTLMVSLEDRETVRQLLEPNLPELPMTMDT